MTKRAMPRTVAMTLSLLALTACGQARPVLILPPMELTECADEPLAPAIGGLPQPERDRLTLDYILGLRSAWGDCKARVDGLRAWRVTAAK